MRISRPNALHFPDNLGGSTEAMPGLSSRLVVLAARDRLLATVRTIVPAIMLAVVLSGCAERDVAPVIVESLDPTDRPSPRGELRVATANLWGVAVMGFDWADEIDARFAALADRLSRNEPDIDVVLIQEAWKDSARHALLAAEGVVQNFPYRIDTVEQPGGAGLVVLSRFRIESAHFHRFEAQGHCHKFWEGDCLSGKGVLALRLKVGDRSIWIADTHLIACYAGREGEETACDQQDPNGSVRWNQLAEARTFVERLVGDEPAIFGGDFNLTRTSRYYSAMTRSAIAGAADGSHGWTETGEDIVDLNRLDYLWTRAGINERWQALDSIRPILTEGVMLTSGKSIPISDHPFLMGRFCLIGDGASGRDLACDSQ